jgi:predicted amidophosphoribosyltransferase
LLAWFIDLLLPRRCVSCGAAADAICDSCRSRLRLLAPPWCGLCGAPTAWPVARCRECAGRRLPFATARAAVAYGGPARALVHGWKERGLRRAASLAAELVVANLEQPTADVITYIPPDPTRQLRRGHHPAERLASELAVRWRMPAERLLVRSRLGARQTGLPRAERGANVRGAFAAPTRLHGTVILVDDVYTTGATVGAAATALRTAGAGRIEVVTFARTVR